MMLFCGLFLSGCGSEVAEEKASSADQSFVQINNISVPVFTTAYEQLNYTRAWFADVPQKRAALEAFIQIYPEERKYRAIAALDLAYLELGKDYRFTYEYSGVRAVLSYLAIIEEYSEYPEILAKAYWYIGWIYSDLLYETAKGLEYYHKVVDIYPDVPVSLLPPAPWVFIIYPNPDEGSGALTPATNRWAALALVEIIRYSEPEEAWLGFGKLWERYGDNPAAGFGLRLILKRRIKVKEAVPVAYEYMKNDFSNIHILGDIRSELQAIEDIESGGRR